MLSLSRLREQWAQRSLVLLIVFVCVSACQPITPAVLPATSTSTLPEPGEVTPVPLPEGVVTPAPSDLPCAYVWGSQELPDVARAVEESMRDVGLPEDIEVNASASGENCIDPETGSSVRFLAMQTDFTISIPVDSVDNDQELGEWIEEMLPVFSRFPSGEVPGPSLGRVQIRFLGKSAEKSLSFPLENGQALLRDGLRGSALYRALESN